MQIVVLWGPKRVAEQNTFALFTPLVVIEAPGRFFPLFKFVKPFRNLA